VPLGFLKNHLFFFGAFNPTWNVNYVEPVPGTGLFSATNGVVERKDTIWDYSGKLTWQLNSNHQIEGSVFGDPTHSNAAPWATLNMITTSANTLQKFGSRNVAVRYSGTFGSSLTLNGAFTMNWNNFAEDRSLSSTLPMRRKSPGYPISGSIPGPGFGSFESYDSADRELVRPSGWSN